jgi:hypothetical protein
LVVAAVVCGPKLSDTDAQKLGSVATAVAAFGGLIGLVVLVVYTRETFLLRKTAQDQVGETQKQTEQSLMPIVVLDTGWSGDRGVFLLRNTGKGPALNTSMQSFSHDRSPQPWFHHRSVIGAGGQDEPVLRIDSGKVPLAPNDFMSFVLKSGSDVEWRTKISYQGVNGCWYQTSHTIKRTSGKLDPIVQWDNFQKLDRRPE